METRHNIDTPAEKLLYAQRKMQRADRMRFLFSHRELFGKHILQLWPEVPTQHRDLLGELIAGTVASNDEQVQDMGKHHNALRTRFHRTLALALLEGDFDQYKMGTEMTGRRIEALGVPTEEPRWLKYRPWSSTGKK